MPDTGSVPADAPPAALVALQNMILGKWISQAVSVAAKLGIADMLKAGPALAMSWLERIRSTQMHCSVFSARWPASACSSNWTTAALV